MWIVFQPNLIWHFEDLGGLAYGWRTAIEKIQNDHLCKGQEQLSKDEASKTQVEPTKLPHVPFQAGESGQTQTSSPAEPMTEESPDTSDIQEPLGYSKQPVGNQNCQLDLGPVNLQAISRNDREELGDSSLYCSLTAEIKLVQSVQVYNDMDVAVATEGNKEQSCDVKGNFDAVSVDSKKLVFNNDEGDAVLVKKKLTNEDYLSESDLVGNEHVVEGQGDQVPCTQEQVLASR